MMQWLRRSFLAGFFVTVPLFISVATLVWLFRLIDGLVGPLYFKLLGRQTPGLGLLTTLLVILLVGVIATNVVGKRLLLGRKLRNTQLGETLLPKRIALPVFASDALSSVGYAPDEIFLTLLAAAMHLRVDGARQNQTTAAAVLLARRRRAGPDIPDDAIRRQNVAALDDTIRKDDRADEHLIGHGSFPVGVVSRSADLRGFAL